MHRSRLFADRSAPSLILMLSLSFSIAELVGCGSGDAPRGSGGGGAGGATTASTGASTTQTGNGGATSAATTAAGTGGATGAATTSSGASSSSSTSASSSSGGSSSSSSSGSSSSGGMSCGGGTASSSDVVLNLSDVHQTIAGFGASTAWSSGFLAAGDPALLWSTTTGAGLSLHRVRIDYTNGHTSELSIAQKAASYGVTVWATPWTPPVADKSNDNAVEGTLTNGQAFATFLQGFVSYMKGQGVNIYAVSSQNEPDANVTYESCVYTGATQASFIGTYMGPAFAGSGVKIIAPETQNWCSFPSFESALQSNAAAWGYTSIVATHEYGCNPAAYPQIQQAGKEFWETEIYDTASTTADPGMGSGLRVAKLIHDAMTIASMNAWHYWWVYPSSDDNGALWDKASGQASKRLWVEGNYARFVRPGYQRIGTTGTAPAGVLLSAYMNPSDSTLAVVAINNNTSTTPVSLYLPSGAPCSFTPWVTSSTESLGSTAAVSVANSHVTLSLGAQSVTTFVGKP